MCRIQGWIHLLQASVTGCIAAGLLVVVPATARADCAGAEDTCFGVHALEANVTGTANSAFGFGALRSNTVGAGNTAIGDLAIADGIDNTQNTAVGQYAMRRAHGAWQNTAIGLLALAGDGQRMTGSYNVGVGAFSLLRNTTGSNNVAIGNAAMVENTSGFTNVAVGPGSLHDNTKGYLNVAVGPYAMRRNTTGRRNVAVGDSALYGANVSESLTGSDNTAVGNAALLFNTSGYANASLGARSLWRMSTGDRNTGVGTNALYLATSGSRNTALGYAAGYGLTTGSDNIILGGGNRGAADDDGVIRIGTPRYQRKAFIAGVRGVQAGMDGAVPVMIDANGQLGTINSSRRYKQDVAPLDDDVSVRLLALRPVTFRYTQAHDDGAQPLEFGLIAEEVAQVFPELVVYGLDGRPETVRYHLLATLLLDALEREHRAAEDRAARLATLESTVAELVRTLGAARNP